MNAETDPAAWDQVLEKALSEAETALDGDDFEVAFGCLDAMELGHPDDADTVTWDRVRELRLRHQKLGERMRSAQGRLQAAMGKTGSSRRAVRAYGAR